jgi:O-acetylhomoserine (thiol)-lyase
MQRLARRPQMSVRQTTFHSNPNTNFTMSASSPFGIGTNCIQAGYTPKVGEARILPIVQSTTFKYDDIEQVRRVMTLQEVGFKYTRTGNPTVSGFEQKINILEGGVGAVATASGQSANVLAIANLVRSGDHVVSASTIYGGTYSLFNSTLPKWGVSVTFVDPEASYKTLAKAFRPNTKALFVETIGNPGLNIPDFGTFAALAKEFDVPFIVDNTLATPFLFQPLKHGANIVTHSATKYIDGHATSIGGVVIDGGNYNWNNGKFPEFTEPDKSNFNVSYTGRFKEKAYLFKARAQYLRDFGACLAPLNAFLFNLGLETLHLRMPRHSDNALALAKFLKTNPEVNWVNYPGLDPKGKKRINKYFERRLASGILTFGLKGDYNRIGRFFKNLHVAALVVHIGDARTGVLHPATSTHAQLTPEEQLSAGISPDLIRVSVGIEDAADIIADFDQAIRTSK